MKAWKLICVTATVVSQSLYASYEDQKNNTSRPDLVAMTARILTADGQFKCSGTVLSGDGLVATAGHCLLDSGDEYMVFVPGHFPVRAKVVRSFMPRSSEDLNKAVLGCLGDHTGLSEEEVNAKGTECLTKVGDDLAILETTEDHDPFTPATVCAEEPTVGETVYSINYPARRLNQSIGVRMEGEGNEVIGGRGLVVSAYIDGGSSGGSLFDKDGKLCGIANSQVDDKDTLEPVAGVASSLPYIFAKYRIACSDQRKCFEEKHGNDDGDPGKLRSAGHGTKN